MHCHHSLGFHSDMLAAIQPSLRSKIHTTQRVAGMCLYCVPMHVHARNIECDYFVYLCKYA